MNIPAADAFSLSPHSHSSRHRRRVPSISMPGTRRSSTRSPSPQVVFPSPSPLAENQKNAAKGLRHVPANTLLLGRVSSQATNGHARLQDVAEDGINNILEGSLDTNKHGENGDIIRDKETRKIDWEIPRKLLHSSIGMPFIRRREPSLFTITCQVLSLFPCTLSEFLQEKLLRSCRLLALLSHLLSMFAYDGRALVQYIKSI